ncbi:MAG: hypothetical protein QOH58_1212 [Thermoleophilaceae bacterium]|jgi:hypothetical protein|nr:hypothetical protein [Thermoleophilaceae bacterium]
MLFDLRGRRRRAVQATYLTLAVLMGGGLVFFGIGGDVSGGLIDAFTGNNSGTTDNSQLDDRIERQEKRLAASPNNPAVLAELVRLNYQAASSQTPSGTAEIPDEAKDELRRAAAYWERYVRATDGKPDPDLARVALIVYDRGGLNQPDKAKEVVRTIAADANDPQAYLLLVQYATAAGDKRTADLAAQKAIDLAPKKDRKQVREAAEQLQTPAPPEQ